MRASALGMTADRILDARRSVPVSDPLPLLVTDFVDTLRNPSALRRERLRGTIEQRVEMLHAPVTHYLAVRS